MTRALHDAAMAAKRFHDAALAYLDRPDERFAKGRAEVARMALEEALKRLDGI